MIDDAIAVQEAGAFAVVLEGIPLDLAAEITERLEIPTIGIGAGVHCDGQVLVMHDLLGLFDRFAPKFSKRYVNLKEIVGGAVQQYVSEVQSGEFPTDAHSFHSPRVVERATGSDDVDARMKTIRSVREMQDWADAERRAGRRIGARADDGLSPRWASLARSLAQTARRPRRRLDLREPDRSSTRATTSRSIRATRRATRACSPMAASTCCSRPAAERDVPAR